MKQKGIDLTKSRLFSLHACTAYHLQGPYITLLMIRLSFLLRSRVKIVVLGALKEIQRSNDRSRCYMFTIKRICKRHVGPALSERVYGNQTGQGGPFVASRRAITMPKHLDWLELQTFFVMKPHKCYHYPSNYGISSAQTLQSYSVDIWRQHDILK